MGQTMAEKVLARCSGRADVVAGEYVTARPDKLMCHEAFAPCALTLRRMGVERLADPDSVYVIIDHFFPAPTAAHAKSHSIVRDLVERYGITHDLGHSGICHQVMVEGGHVGPGELVLGTDSHSTTYGALGAAGAGIGVTEMTYALALGELWFQVPPTVRFSLSGAAGPAIMAKDVVLRLAGQFGTDVAQYAAIEFSGSLCAQMGLASRMTMANMGAELGAKFAMFPTEAFGPDQDAEFAAVHSVDVTGLEPQVSQPHNPGNVVGVSAVAGVRVDQAFLGSCTNARVEDLAVAAHVLAGRRVHPRTRLIVTPASQAVYLEALRAGHIEALAAAGAAITAPGCGACPGGHSGVIGPGEVCVSSTNRNFRGRMGSAEGFVYLASPAVVAMAALTGELSDPRELVSEPWL
jgi:3-isopropylmalate/(R)-2-methylmalate dehydratase large subunit